jgi:hypothetical protein
MHTGPTCGNSGGGEGAGTRRTGKKMPDREGWSVKRSRRTH